MALLIILCFFKGDRTRARGSYADLELTNQQHAKSVSHLIRIIICFWFFFLTLFISSFVYFLPCLILFSSCVLFVCFFPCLFVSSFVLSICFIPCFLLFVPVYFFLCLLLPLFLILFPMFLLLFAPAFLRFLLCLVLTLCFILCLLLLFLPD